ncbi:MAG: hypothetical protein ACR2GD_08095 [Pyrinomonadaceae bacterium]
MSTAKISFPRSTGGKLRAWNLKLISVKITNCRRPKNPFYKLKKNYLIIILFFVVALCGARHACAQNLEIKIKILPSSRVRIEGKLLDSTLFASNNEISFPQNYADVSALAERIENLRLFNAKGAKIEFRKLAAGEFQAASQPASFAYDVKIDVPENPTAAAHVSWLAANQGILMTGDLLPELNGARKISGKVTFEIPADWRIASGETKLDENVFAVENLEKAVFLVGQNFREKTRRIGETNLNLAIGGAWQFSDDEAAQMAASILAEYRKMFGEIPAQRAQIILLPFERAAANPESWRAETRGRTVTIISGALTSKRESVQRLCEQLRHEIFHLWIPNAVNLTGNYDWFYEGFTVYEALRTGVWTNQIRFEDYLKTLAQAFDLAKNQNSSLVEMSDKRWLGKNNSVYARGMLAAFLCDLAILNQSKGRRLLTDVFQKIYRAYHDSNSSADGTTAILEILKSYPELNSIIQNYIEGAAKIQWQNQLNQFGVEASDDGETRLQVASKLDGRQKDLLDKLGYNNWRKLLRTKK